jgi:hypothetical protein
MTTVREATQMSDRSVSIRLGTEGKAQVKSDFTEIADSGDASAKRLVASYDKAGDDIEKALARRDAAAAKIQAMMPSPVQATIEANNGSRVGQRDAGGGPSAGQNATATEYAALLAQQEKQVAAVRAAIDPLYTAQKRYDDEIRVADGLLKSGAISEAEHAAAVGLSGKALAAAERELGGHSNALSLNRNQLIIGESAVHRFVDSILAGQSPMKAFAMQAGDVGNVLSMDDGGVAGGLAKVRALLTPTNLTLGATAALVAIGAAAWYSYSSALEKLEAISQGAGRVLGESGAELEANAEAAAAAGNISISSAREIEQAYLGVAKSGDVLVGLTAITKDFAAATGTDAKAAEQALTSIFSDPIAGANELAEKYGMLSQAQVDHIAKLVEEGQATQAQRELLEDLGKSVDGASDHVTGLAAAWDLVKTKASNAFSAIGSYLNREGPGLVFSLTGIPLPGTFGEGKGPPPRQNDAAANKARADAAALAQRYQGDDRDKIQSTIGVLRAGIAAGGAPDEVKAWTDALQANEHALTTWIPAQQKATELASLDAKIAAAKSPADKAALAAQRARVELQGKVITGADAEAQAHSKGAAALATASRAGAGHAATLAREAASMEASARAALDVAAAYLQSDGAGALAEARRKAITDATKKGIDVEAEARRQIALSIADSIASGAKSVSGLRLETAARTSVNLQVSNGALAVGLMNQALGDEAALRPLLKLQALAQGDALAQLTTVIDVYRKALAEAHAEEAHGQALQSLDALKQRVDDARLATQFAGDTSGNADRARARAAGNREADQRGYNDNDRSAVVQGNVDATSAELTARRAQSAAEALRTSQNQVELTQAEVGLIGKSADEHDRVVSRLQLQQQLAQELGDDYAKFAPSILAAADAAVQDQQRFKQLQSTMSELQSTGDQFIDTLFRPNGDVLKSLLKEVEQELLKLAAINPLKNLLLGESNPTLASVGGLLGGKSGSGLGGLLGKVLGHGVDLSSLDSPALNIGGGIPSSMAVSSIDLSSFIPHFASGTEYSPGGFADVGENGMERVFLPQGSKVTNAADTRRMMSAANDPAHIKVSVETNDPAFTAKISSISGAHVQAAAPSIRAGAVSDVKEHYARQGRNRYPGG